MRTLYRGGAVHTPADPAATALVVDGDTIAWIGAEEAASTHADAVDRVVELDGALVAPAFVDAHVHVTETGLALANLDLRGARSVAAVLDLVEAAARRGGGRPVLGHGWDERLLAEGRAPTRAELDRASAGGVVYLARVDVHSAVISSALAAAADVAAHEGWDGQGRVERTAHSVARSATRAGLSVAGRREAQLTALRAAAAAGIACVHEMSAPHVGGAADLATLTALTALTPQTAAHRPAADDGASGGGALPEVRAYWGRLVRSEEEAREQLRTLAVPVVGLAGDLCADGAVGSRTAAFRDPYADAAAAGLPPDHRGHLYLSADEVRDHVEACTRAGVQAGFHVIGDAAMDTVLEGFRRAAERVGLAAVRAMRHRLEHAETLDGEAVARIADLGVTASVQPAFDAAWGGSDGMYAQRLGTGRALAMNPIGSLAAAGVLLALGSDSPVTRFAPWEAVRACAFHHVEEQRTSARAAFSAHTRGGRRSTGQDGEGVLVVGAPATFAVWAVDDLVVQAPDDRIQAWSTDPRSGTPGLPDLTPGTPAPTCLATVGNGRSLHDGGLLASQT